MLKFDNKMTSKQVMKLGMSLSVVVDALMYRSEEPRLNSSHGIGSRMPSSA